MEPIVENEYHLKIHKFAIAAYIETSRIERTI